MRFDSPAAALKPVRTASSPVDGATSRGNGDEVPAREGSSTKSRPSWSST